MFSTLFNTNNSIKHQLFIFTQLNDETVLFQTIQFSISFVCTKFNWIVSDTEKYLETFNCAHMNEKCGTELLILNRNTWNSYWIIGIKLPFFEPFDGMQMNELCWI